MERRGIKIVTRQTVDAVEKVEHGFCVSNRESFVVDKAFATAPPIFGHGARSRRCEIAATGGTQWMSLAQRSEHLCGRRIA
jgi:hypothetical protein